MIAFTLHRYVFRELFRVFVLATTALTLILSLGSMLRPIQEYGVGPEQAIRILGYFLPITLTFVLPMGSLFAAALVYGRFASDNELDACRASGIGLMTLVYPGLCLAIITAIATLILSFHVVPAFVHRAEKAIKANAKQILFRNIQRKGYYKMRDGRFKIYADQARSDEDLLTGVVIIKSEGLNIEKLITAKVAKILFDSGKKSDEIKVIAKEAFQIDDFGQGYSKELPVSGRFPSMLSDNIKFQRIDQIKRIQANMMEFGPVEDAALSTRAQFAIELLAEDISKKIKDDQNSYYQLIGQDRIVMFTAHECFPKDGRTIELAGPIRLVEYKKVSHEQICQWDSKKGFIQLEGDQMDSTMVMVLENPRWERSDGTNSLARRHAVKNLPLPDSITAKVGKENLLATLESIPSILKTAPTEALLGLYEKLEQKITATSNEIIAETHSRLVFGVGCITLILIGIALGIIFKGGHLLSAFGASAIPFAVLIMFMMSGRQLTKNPLMSPSVGIMVTWSGLIILSVLALLIYRKLLKT